jgi:hypothetical protein
VVNGRGDFFEMWDYYLVKVDGQLCPYMKIRSYLVIVYIDIGFGKEF